MIFSVFLIPLSRTPDEFLTFLNAQHHNLTFTVEQGPRSLPFLDVNVEFSNGTPVFSVFRKPTHTGLLLNFTACCPIAWKRSLVRCLIMRAFSICSNWTLFHKEICNLRNIFKTNGYPFSFSIKLQTLQSTVC